VRELLIALVAEIPCCSCCCSDDAYVEQVCNAIKLVEVPQEDRGAVLAACGWGEHYIEQLKAALEAP
jgi:hypothetical protein